METSVNNKCRAFTSLEQSKKLTEILPLDSADMCYIQDKPNIGFLQEEYEEFGDSILQDYFPCWTLTALLSVLPKIQGCKPIIALDDNYITYPRMNGLHTKADNLIDACVEMILKLDELKML